MRLGFVVNRIETEKEYYTTTRLARAALARGHDVWYVDAEGFSCRPDASVGFQARTLPGRGYRSEKTFLEALQGEEAPREHVDAGDLDVLMLRNNPAEDAVERPWAQSAGIVFGQLAVERGLLVVNDPGGLSRALNKAYLEYFPETIRPRTLVSRDRDELRAFVEDMSGPVVLKPLQGSGGESVFLVPEDDPSNLNQMLDAVARLGYVIAQEYLPAAADHDTRLFLMNGHPLKVDGRYAAIRRVRAKGDLRTNMSAGGTAEKAVIDETILEIAEIVRPRLIQDGMFLVGLDIAGDRVMEVNVFSPGGLGNATRFEQVDFAAPILDSLEAKVEHRRAARAPIENTRLATV